MNKNGSECIKILLHYDHANVDAKDRSQRTPIMYAIINGIDSIIIGKIQPELFHPLKSILRSSSLDMLLTKCQHFDAIDQSKNNILHYACLVVSLEKKKNLLYKDLPVFRLMNRL